MSEECTIVHGHGTAWRKNPEFWQDCCGKLEYVGDLILSGHHKPKMQVYLCETCGVPMFVRPDVAGKAPRE